MPRQESLLELHLKLFYEECLIRTLVIDEVPLLTAYIHVEKENSTLSTAIATKTESKG